MGARAVASKKQGLGIVAALLCCLLSVGSMAETHEPMLNTVYRQANSWQFYNQTDVVESLSFQDKSKELQDQMVEAEFKRRLTMAYAYNTGCNVAYVLGAALCVYIAKNRVVQVGNFLQQFQVYGMVTAGLFWTPLQTFVARLIEETKGVVLAIKKIGFGSELDKLEAIEREYVRQKRHIPPAFWARMEANFIEARLPADRHARRISTDPVKYAQQVLDLPLMTKAIHYDARMIDEKLSGGYSSEELREIKRYCVRHAAASQTESVRKVAAYFWGPAGVGKTRAAQLSAEAMGVPFVTISLKNGRLSDLTGDMDQPGLIYEAITRVPKEMRVKNLIVLIDDVDRVLNDRLSGEILSFLLNLFEPETHSYFNPYFGAEIDVRHVGFILAGNSRIKDAALESRFQVVEFKGYSADYKKAVVWGQLFDALLEPHLKSSLQVCAADFNEQDRAEFNLLVDADTDPGFRTTKLNLMRFIEDKVLQKYFDQESLSDSPNCGTTQSQ